MYLWPLLYSYTFQKEGDSIKLLSYLFVGNSYIDLKSDTGNTLAFWPYRYNDREKLKDGEHPSEILTEYLN